jgi:hypothetical protein
MVHVSVPDFDGGTGAMKLNRFRRKRKMQVALDPNDDLFFLWAVSGLVDMVISMTTDN